MLVRVAVRASGELFMQGIYGTIKTVFPRVDILSIDFDLIAVLVSLRFSA